MDIPSWKDIRFDEEEFKLLSIQVEKLQKKKDRFSILSSLMAKEPGLLQQEKEIHNKIKYFDLIQSRITTFLEAFVNQIFDKIVCCILFEN